MNWFAANDAGIIKISCFSPVLCILAACAETCEDAVNWIVETTKEAAFVVLHFELNKNEKFYGTFERIFQKVVL